MKPVNFETMFGIVISGLSLFIMLIWAFGGTSTANTHLSELD